MTLKRISMRDQVYEIIKNRILSREYSLGEPINIVHLSKELGISNTPIREALSQLETERLITINSNQKYHVTDLNEKLINDLCSVVLIHLLGAFKVCRDNGKMPVLISKLRKAFEKQQEMYDASNSNDYVAASMDFEWSFIIAADNPMLEKTYDVVITLLTLSITYDQISHRERNIEEHREILEAIEANDVSKAEELLSKHYNNRAEHIMYLHDCVKKTDKV